MKYALGLNLRSHDVAFYLVDENRDLVFGVEEERFSYVRHRIQETYLALDYMLEREGIAKDDIVAVGLAASRAGHDELVAIHERLYGRPMADANRRFVDQLFSLKYSIIDSMGLRNARVVEVPHHLAHALCGFAASPFDSAAVLAIDGSGDQYTTALYHFGKDRYRRLMAIERPHSLGWIWEAVTGWAHLGGLGQEGKLMGLAAYGEPIYRRHFYDGFERHPSLPVFQVDWQTGAFTSPVGRELFGRRLTVSDLLGPLEPYTGLPPKLARDVAASLQQVTNEMVLALSRWAREVTGAEHLVLTGGVAMNSVTNGEVIRHACYRSVFVPPNAGDNGIGLGSALYAIQEWLPRPAYKLRRHGLPYTGPAFGDDEIAAALAAFGLPALKVADLEGMVADRLADGLVVGWFQGRMEVGARALGNRSILASPCLAHMKDVVNERVKLREPWRPFGPLIKQEKYREWFDDPHDDLPYMTSTHTVQAHQRQRIPSAVHTDGTGRVQTCSPRDNPRLHRLLDAFERRTGVPILLNTSFNIKGMPIVCRPRDAIECLLATGIDLLAIGDYLVARPEGALAAEGLSPPVRFFDSVVDPEDEVVLIADQRAGPPPSGLEAVVRRKRLRARWVDLAFDGWQTLESPKVFVVVDYANNFPNGHEKLEAPMRLLKRARSVGAIPDNRLFLLNLSGASWILGQMFGEAQWGRVRL